MGVSISPGAIAFTRMPYEPKSAAISRVNAASAAFDVAYAVPANGCTRLPAMDVTFTIEPCPSFNSCINPLASTIGAKKLTSNTSRQIAIPVSAGPSRFPWSSFGDIPALLTNACNAPPASLFFSSASPIERWSGSPRSI